MVLREDMGQRQLTLARPTFPRQKGCHVGGFGEEEGSGSLEDR